jgi:hypothetical protein
MENLNFTQSQLIELNSNQLKNIDGGILEMMFVEMAIVEMVKQYQIRSAIESCINMF